MKTLNDIYNSLFFLLQVIEITNRKITNMIIDNYRLRVFFPSFSHMKKKESKIYLSGELECVSLLISIVTLIELMKNT